MSSLLHDFGRVLTLAAIALAAGAIANTLRDGPLPLVYRTPAEQLVAETTTAHPAPAAPDSVREPEPVAATAMETPRRVEAETPTETLLPPPPPGSAPDATTAIQVIDVDAARTLAGSDFVIVLDARERHRYEAGHLPGALNLFGRQFDRDFESLRSVLEPGKYGMSILVYCKNPACPDASLVARKLVEKGYPDILIFEGGWDDWQRSGLPVETASDGTGS